jgi:SMC interacting uncharacterized protein involved in chromosome segregation
VSDETKRLQVQLDKHSTQIAKLFSKVDDTNASIQKIVNTLNQIRWTFFGAIGYYAVSEIGIIEAMRIAV